uniref:Endoplasmic reticulum-golgi intermediate compartment protein, putative n=1 Tax=Entamoeba invadens TaxID=33085 RepID=S0B191_ENTIV|nr:endoplasmic reticulum-golgi intermediate compartment protein, putative [Entamoeba invadens]
MKRFDAYGKVPEDLQVKHGFGGIMTIVCGILIGILVLTEFRYYLQREVTPQLIVDRERDEKIKVHFDITFPFSSCPITSVDVLTKSGESMIDIEKNITKTRLNKNGVPLTESELKATQQKLNANIKTVDQKTCRSCYGAETPSRKCCYTCDDVIEAYKERGWNLNIRTIAQCDNSEKLEMAKLTLEEGCRVEGNLLLNKIGGNFHIAPGTSDNTWTGHHHNIEWTGRTKIDLTHTWNDLSFGEGSKTYSGSEKDAKMNGMFQYFLTLIPKKNNFINGTKFVYDFVINEQTRSGQGEGEPGVFVYYDVSPMLLEVNEFNHGFLHFLIGVCAIIGGVFTVFQLIDAFVFDSIHTLQKKIELGKDI